MPLFTYTRDRPNPPNNPSSDVPSMKINCNSIDDLIDVDHFSFGEANGGLHRQMQIVNQTLIPAGLIAGEGTLYTKAASGASQLFYSRDASGIEIQMTSTGITPGPITPTYTPVNANPGTITYVTFLPGNTVLISGTIVGASSTQQVTFGFNITAIISINITRLNTSPNSTNIGSFHEVLSLASTPGGFTFKNYNSGGGGVNGRDVMWQLFGVL